MSTYNPVRLFGISGPISSSNPLPVSSSASETSAGNTTIVPLGSGATFTGDAEQNASPDVMVSCQTDNSGTLFFDFSVDGTNFSTFPVNGFDVASGIHEFHTAVKGPRYFRVRFVNDTGAQSYLRLYTYFGQFRQGNAPLNQTIGIDSDAIITRSVDSGLDLAFGNFAGMSEDSKFGYIENISTSIVRGNSSTWVDLWYQGGQRTSPETSFTPFMASSNASDTDVDVTWTYQDTDGVEQTVTVTTDSSNGRTPVSLGVTATELYRGTSDQDHDGDIAVAIVNDFSNGSPNNQDEILAVVAPNDHQTQLAMGRVPANTRRRITNLYVPMLRNSGSAGSIQAVFQTRESGGIWKTRRPIFATSESPYNEKVSGIVLPPLTDFRIRIRDVSDSSTYVSATISFEDLQE